jgi:hypothetical protein
MSEHEVWTRVTEQAVTTSDGDVWRVSRDGDVNRLCIDFNVDDEDVVRGLQVVRYLTNDDTARLVAVFASEAVTS